MPAQQHDLERTYDQVRPRGMRDNAGDTVVEEALDGFGRCFVDQDGDGCRRARAANRLKLAEPVDVEPVDRDEVETLVTQQPARLKTVVRIVDAGVTVDLSQQGLQSVTPLGV